MRSILLIRYSRYSVESLSRRVIIGSNGRRTSNASKMANNKNNFRSQALLIRISFISTDQNYIIRLCMFDECLPKQKEPVSNCNRSRVARFKDGVHLFRDQYWDLSNDRRHRTKLLPFFWLTPTYHALLKGSLGLGFVRSLRTRLVLDFARRQPVPGTRNSELGRRFSMRFITVLRPFIYITLILKKKDSN